MLLKTGLINYWTSWKKHWLQEKKHIFLNMLFFILGIFVLVFLDQITKWKFTNFPPNWCSQIGKNLFIFSKDEPQILISFVNFGIWSVGNTSTTIFNFLGINSSKIFLNVLSFFIFFGSVFYLFWTIKKINISVVVALIFLNSGVIGNTIDRFVFQGVVRDVFFIFSKKSIWNLADMWIYFGIFVGFFCTINIIFFKTKKKD